MMATREEETQSDLIHLLDEIEALLAEVRGKVIDGDSEMHQILTEAQNGK